MNKKVHHKQNENIHNNNRTFSATMKFGTKTKIGISEHISQPSNMARDHNELASTL